MPFMGLFCGCFTFSRFDGIFLSRSLTVYEFSSYTQTERPGTMRFVPKSYIGPVRGDCVSYRIVLLLFDIFTISCLVFRPKSLNVTNAHRILKLGGRGLRGRFVRVTLIPYEVLVPLTWPFGGYFDFSPTNAMFYSYV